MKPPVTPVSSVLSKSPAKYQTTQRKSYFFQVNVQLCFSLVYDREAQSSEEQEHLDFIAPTEQVVSFQFRRSCVNHSCRLVVHTHEIFDVKFKHQYRSVDIIRNTSDSCQAPFVLSRCCINFKCIDNFVPNYLSQLQNSPFLRQKSGNGGF